MRTDYILKQTNNDYMNNYQVNLISSSLKMESQLQTF